MIVYHGSKEKFERFNLSKIGLNGTSEGKGIYFTNSETVAKGYGENGYLYTVKFNGQKHLNEQALTISENELRTFLETLDKEMDYLENWGEVSFEGYESVMNAAIEGELSGSDNDVDLVSGICNASGNVGRALEIVYETLGYDSIVTDAEWGNGQKLYIALVPDVIEIQKVEKQF